MRSRLPGPVTNTVAHTSQACAFAARYTTTGNGNFNNATPLILGVVDYNIGAAYNATTGKFTAPRKGIYLFTASLMTTGSLSGENPAWDFLVDGVGYLRIHHSNSSTLSAQSLTGTLQIQLNAGQTVWIQCISCSNAAWHYSTYLTPLFTGLLVIPL